jgi:large subunit ribosomal protein L47
VVTLLESYKRLTFSDIVALTMLTNPLGNKQVMKTQKAIKFALTERFYAWEDARTLALEDPEIDLSGKGNAYTPSGYRNEDVFEEEILEAGEATAEESSGTHENSANKEAMFPDNAAPEKSIDPSTIPAPVQPNPSAKN